MQTYVTASRHWFRAFLLAATAVLIAGSLAAAQEQDRPRDKSSASAPAAERRAPADAPNARMMALVRSGGVVILSKGVESVTRIAAGVYCIRPEAATGIDPQTAIAVVSVEYFYSHFNEVQVQWARRGHTCGNDRFGVYTLGDLNLDGVYTFTNRVGFVIYVP